MRSTNHGRHNHLRQYHPQTTSTRRTCSHVHITIPVVAPRDGLVGATEPPPEQKRLRQLPGHVFLQPRQPRARRRRRCMRRRVGRCSCRSSSSRSRSWSFPRRIRKLEWWSRRIYDGLQEGGGMETASKGGRAVLKMKTLRQSHELPQKYREFSALTTERRKRSPTSAPLASILPDL